MQDTIYNHNYRLNKEAESILQSDELTDKNKQLIKDFDRAIFLLEGLGKARRIKILQSLKIIAKKLKKNFDQATKEDIKKIIQDIEENDNYSIWTKHGYKIIIRKFYKWLEYGDDYVKRNEYPERVSWFITTVKKKDRHKVNASDILTEKEVEKLIKHAEHTRDKAFVSMIYELGARIGEISILKIKDISKDKYSYIVDLEGKTGHRTPRIIIASPYLTNWLNGHPDKDNPEAWLWVKKGVRDYERMQYQSFRILLIRLAEKCSIKKRVYPHLFRHTRVTHLLVNKQINESQAKVYFGWTPDSGMLSEYSHLVIQDVNDALLEMHGIKTSTKREPQLKPKICPVCENINPKDYRFCGKCGNILDVQTAIALDQEREKYDDVMDRLMQDKEYREITLKKIQALQKSV